jgi:hypothetical protein
MKKLFLSFVVIVVFAALPNRIMAQATQSTSAAGKIIAPVTLTKNTDLHFGTMSVLTATAGTCVLSTAGVRSATGGVNLSASAPVSSTASYTVGGSASTTYAITLPASITVTAVTTMTIDNLLAHTASAGADGLTGTLSGGGADTFTVGGTLNVAAAQASGLYTGTFNVTVAYN